MTTGNPDVKYKQKAEQEQGFTMSLCALTSSVNFFAVYHFETGVFECTEYRIDAARLAQQN